MTASLCETATPGTAELLGWVGYIVTIISPGFFFHFILIFLLAFIKLNYFSVIFQGRPGFWGIRYTGAF